MPAVAGASADQILVGTNRKRLRNNRIYRTVKGHVSPFPEGGERLVCLKNKAERGLLNGGLWDVERVISIDGSNVVMEVAPEDGGGAVKVSVPKPFFIGGEDQLDWRTLKRLEQFTFGYALTVHKAQGSQWDDVVIFDESPVFREHRANHLYTAITRAAEKVTVVQ